MVPPAERNAMSHHCDRPGRAVRHRARRLRTYSTDAERRIWQELRAHRLAGFGFRRQHPIGPYIVDFICLAAGLVVEVDGGQHFAPADLIPTLPVFDRSQVGHAHAPRGLIPSLNEASSSRLGISRNARRDAYLASMGLRVLRFSNLDVLHNLPGVLETLLEAVSHAAGAPESNLQGILSGGQERHRTRGRPMPPLPQIR